MDFDLGDSAAALRRRLRELIAAHIAEDYLGAFTSDPADLDVAMNGVWVCKQSAPQADPATVDLKPREVSVTIDLKAGSERATVWTNDLTHAYVHENSAYSS